MYSPNVYMEGLNGTWSTPPALPTTFPLVHSWPKAPHTIEQAAEGRCAAPRAPGGARPWNQHTELGPIATSEASRGQESLLVEGLAGHLCRRRGED